MDEVDKKLVVLLQQNSGMPLKALGEQVFLSAPAVAARIEKLEKDNIIEGYIARVNIERLGYGITAFINLNCEKAPKEEVYLFLQNCPNVLECNCVMEDSIMLIKVAFKNTEELDNFIGSLKKYGTTDTMLVTSTPVVSRGIDIMKTEEDF